MRRLWWFCVSLIVFLVDQLTKHWVLTRLPVDGIRVFPGFNLQLRYNDGVAFSWLSHGQFQRWPLVGVALVASIFLGICLCRLPRKRSWALLGVACVLGGALGNAFDRVQYAVVIDFIDLFFRTYHFPTFNLADAGISVGVVLLMIDYRLQSVLPKREAL